MTSKSAGETMPKAYSPAAVESATYERWQASGAFTPRPDPGREPYTIIMPPPNLTGELHLGHALMDTVEDALIRWRRMQGRAALWLPGVDHAAIAVHTLIERELADEGLKRQDVGREAFLERTWRFVNRNRERIFEQHKRLGVSADFSRERFTMDPVPATAVRKLFVDLYEKGLIYRGNRLINWCPRCQSALSDLEVDHEDEDSFLWQVRYPLIDDSGVDTGEYISIATTRPETIVADTGIAVHPDDDRFQSLRGARARLPIIGRELPIVFDQAIDPAFGTGALKVTPAHDPVDFEIGERHGLAIINAVNADGSMNDEAGPYAGLDRFQARDAIVAGLQEQGLLEKQESHSHAVGHCDRCGTIVEPLLSDQWFMAMTKEYGGADGSPRSLAGDALKAVREGWLGPDGRKKQIRMVPERHTRVYENWLENIRDWCISRQLWWGHRIPVWYCDACGEMTVAMQDPDRCAHCGAASISQDEDTLDTWFSSALWPMSTLGWPQKTEDLDYFYPTSVMETGYDIIFLWVARMIMMGLFTMDEIPFEWVYFHGTVRDDEGQRMSKSKGNGVDPIELVEKYGTDALRFKLVTAGGTGNDQRLEEPRMEAARNFANKLWNVSRFVLSNLEPGERVAAIEAQDRASLPPEDRWILSRSETVAADANRLMERFELGEAGRQVQDFIWDEFCDWYVEIAKVRLRSGAGPSPVPVLVRVLDSCLRLLHPYMPYVTEELWSGSGNLRAHLADVEEPTQLVVAAFPLGDAALRDEVAEREMELVLDIVRAIRNLRRERNLDAGRWIETYVISGEPLGRHAAAIESLARARPLRIEAERDEAPSTSAASVVIDRAQIIIPLAGLFDVSAERNNLEKQRFQSEGQVKSLTAKLANGDFTSKAPANVVDAERERLAVAEERLAELELRIAEIGAD